MKLRRSDVRRVVAELSQAMGRGPGAEKIAEHLQQDLATMETLLAILVQEGHLAVDAEGRYAVISPQPELFPVTHEPTEEPILPASPVKRASPRSQRKAKKEREQIVGRWQITVIRAVMAASGVGASIVSGYFTIMRLGEFMPRGLAALLGTFLVSFAVIAFETVLVFIQRKGYFIAGLFILLWGIVAAFTLTATVAGFYSYYAAVRVDRARAGAGEEVHRIELQSVRSNIAELARRLEEQRGQLGPLQTIVADASSSVERRSQYGRVFYDAQTRILGVQREMDRLQASLDVERQKEARILSQAPAAALEASRPSVDFYAWTGGLLGISPGTMELVSAIFPSVFIDLISSIGLAVALFLSTEGRGRRGDSA